MLLNPYRFGGAPAIPGTAERWQLTGLTVGGSVFEISELHLYEGVSLAAGATLSSTYTGDSGTSVSALYDEDTSTRIIFNLVKIAEPDFAIEFEFASAKAIDGIRFAGFDTDNRHSSTYTVKYWDGAAWVLSGTVSGLTYPGNFTYSSVATIV
jgi:hypothetical protein